MVLAAPETPAAPPATATPEAPAISVAVIPGTDADVRRLLGAYLAKNGLRDDGPSRNVTWLAVSENGALALVFAVGLDSAGGVVGTDFYAQPSRAGVRAVNAVLTLFRGMIDAGVFPHGAVSVLTANHVMRRRLERIFAVDGPATVNYHYRSGGR